MISIIIPVYNVEPRYLKECLKSVTGQSFKRIEIICVDDGSTDGSLKILKKYAKKDKRIIVIHQKNQGPSAARNTGIERALKSSSKYILFVDSDDILAENACEILLAAAEEDDNIDIVAFNFQIFPTKQHLASTKWHWHWWKSFKNEIYKNDPDACISMIMAKQRCPLWDKLYRKDILKEVKFVDSISFSEDICFSLMVLPRVRWMKCISDTLYSYRVDNPSSLTRITKREKRHDDALRIMKYVCADWRKLGLLNKHKNILLSLLVDRINQCGYPDRDYTSDFIDAFGDDILNANTIKKLPEDTQKKLRTLCKQWSIPNP
ncbi:MAG: glycosyltransferase [Oscillospiraceae bacterium]|nr:glycosyltransferase [Oscillospiraceae bacterium]